MKAVIAAYARSPQTFCPQRPLAHVRPDTMAAQVVVGLLERTRLDPALIEDVILGCAYPEGPQGSNIARIVALLAGLPLEVGGMTVNRFCGSSMSAIQIAAAQIEAGIGDAYLCVGVESMSMVPQGGFNRSPNPELLSRFADAYISMGQTAENVAQRYNISRHDQEVMAVDSHRKAAQAREQGRLRDEIVPIRSGIRRTRFRGWLHSPRHLARGFGRAQTRLFGERRGDRRHLLAFDRRCIGSAADQRGICGTPWLASVGAHSSGGHRGLRSRGDGYWADSRHSQSIGARRPQESKCSM